MQRLPTADMQLMVIILDTIIVYKFSRAMYMTIEVREELSLESEE